MSDVKSALIIGGGIGGMSAAICLRRTGIEVDVVEADPQWRQVGAGLTLNGATLRAFARVGVLDAIREQGDVHGGNMIYDPAGNLIEDNSLPNDAAPPVAAGGILRPVLHDILSKRTLASGVRVQLGVTVESLSQTLSSVSVRLSNGEANQYDLVVGADGLHSKTRKMIFPDAPAPHFTGQGCWRAVFKRPESMTTSAMFIDSHNKAGVKPVSKDEIYLYLVETAPQNPWYRPEDWPDMLRDRLTPFGGLVAELRETVDETSQVNYRPLETLMLPDPWYKGRVLLIGDAAHATTPQCAYGAGLAVEDGVVLGELLGRDAPLDVILERFMARRYERCRMVVEGSCKLGEFEMNHSPLSEHRALTKRMAEAICTPI